MSHILKGYIFIIISHYLAQNKMLQSFWLINVVYFYFKDIEIMAIQFQGTRKKIILSLTLSDTYPYLVQIGLSLSALARDQSGLYSVP